MQRPVILALMIGGRLAWQQQQRSAESTVCGRHSNFGTLLTSAKGTSLPRPFKWSVLHWTDSPGLDRAVKTNGGALR